MAKKYYSTLTKIGLNAIARATTMNEKVKFSKFCIGDAEIHPDVTTTALGHEVWQGSLSSIVVDENNPNWIVLTCIISATVGGFTIREVGIKDEDGNLLAVASYPETYKPILAEGAGKDLIVRVILEVSNTEVVELKIDPTVSLATRSDLEAIEKKKANKEEVKKLEEKVEKVEQKVTEGVENLDVSGKQIEFEEASTRTLPKTGDTLKTIISKITKFLSDLKKVAFTGKYSDLTGIPASFPPAAHNHDDRYLGKTAKAADSDKLDGHDSIYFATAAQLQEVFQYAVDGKQTLINEINKALGSDSGLTTSSTWEEIINRFKSITSSVHERLGIGVLYSDFKDNTYNLGNFDDVLKRNGYKLLSTVYNHELKDVTCTGDIISLILDCGYNNRKAEMFFDVLYNGTRIPKNEMYKYFDVYCHMKFFDSYYQYQKINSTDIVNKMLFFAPSCIINNDSTSNLRLIANSSSNYDFSYFIVNKKRCPITFKYVTQKGSDESFHTIHKDYKLQNI